MVIKFKEYLITESPDTLKTAGITHRYDDTDAIPFFSSISKDGKLEDMYIGRKRVMHRNMGYPTGGDRAYPGRLWLDSKLMSFWVYPDERLFKSMILSLEDKLGIKIFNNGWQIEVIENDGKIIKKKVGDDLYVRKINDGDVRDIISLDYYTGSNDVPEKIRLQHLMNWKEKELAKKSGEITSDFGSSLTSWDKPHNIRYRQKVYQERYKN